MCALQPLAILGQIPNCTDAFCQSTVSLTLMFYVFSFIVQQDLSLKAVQTASTDITVLVSVVWFQGHVIEIIVQYWT